jgi:putative acetyltransferase
VKRIDFTIRRAAPADVDEIAAAHLDSIRSIGRLYYDASVVNDWAAGLTGDLYLSAMAGGEVFYVAVDGAGETPEVLGFSSHRVDDTEHGVTVYVRGKAARRGVGSALLMAAEAHAIAVGAASLHLDASLAAVEFYKAHGFQEVGRGEHRLASGGAMASVFMRKILGGGPVSDASGAVS